MKCQSQTIVKISCARIIAQCEVGMGSWRMTLNYVSLPRGHSGLF